MSAGGWTWPAHWLDQGRELSRLERTSPRSDTGVAWVKDVAGRTGYSTNELRQIQRAAAFVDANISRGGAWESQARLRPWTQIEVIARIAKIDPALAALIIENPGSNRTVRALRSVLRSRVASTSAPSPQSQGKKDSADMVAVTIRALADRRIAFPAAVQVRAADLASIDDEFGGRSENVLLSEDIHTEIFAEKYRIEKWRLHSIYVSPSAVLVYPDRMHWEGLLVASSVSDGRDPSVLRPLVSRLAFESTFFSRYWVALRSSACDNLREHLIALSISNVGVLGVDLATGTVSVEHWPEKAEPTPDRRNLLHPTMSQ